MNVIDYPSPNHSKRTCWMSFGMKAPHVLGKGLGCLICEAVRRAEAQQQEGALAQGLQRPAVARYMGVGA